MAHNERPRIEAVQWVPLTGNTPPGFEQYDGAVEHLKSKAAARGISVDIDPDNPDVHHIYHPDRPGVVYSGKLDTWIKHEGGLRGPKRQRQSERGRKGGIRHYPSGRVNL